MNSHSRDHVAGLAAGAGTSKLFATLTVVVIVGTGLFIVALAVGLGVGFGVGLRTSRPRVNKLSPPLFTCSSSATCGCSAIKPVFTPRIINGDAAVTNSWPWMAYLTVSNIRTCTGFLISRRHVLTTASCIGQYMSNITVNLGMNNYQSSFGGVNVTNSIALTSSSFGDIAIVTLGVNITYNTTIQPCCLTSALTETYINTPGVIAGWGETSANSIGVVSPTLRQAVVRVRDPYICGASLGNETFCASYGSISACPIDAGGPLMLNVNNAWTCVGIITGKPLCSNPITFTRIATYSAIIKNITELVFLILI